MNEFLSSQSNQSIGAFGVAIFLSIFFVIVGSMIKKADPLKKPTGLIVIMELFYGFIDDLSTSIFHGRYKGIAPYAATLFIYILTMNYSSLFLPIDAPTTDYNVPLGLVLITLCLIHGVALKENGIKGYIKDYASPIPVMLPLNLMDIVAKPLSMSMRLFGNILSGSMILMVLAMALGGLQSMILPGLSPNGVTDLNIIYGLVAPPFRFYFDIFAGGIQAFVFTLLTLIFTSLSLNFDD